MHDIPGNIVPTAKDHFKFSTHLQARWSHNPYAASRPRLRRPLSASPPPPPLIDHLSRASDRFSAVPPSPPPPPPPPPPLPPLPPRLLPHFHSGDHTGGSVHPSRLALHPSRP
ncbi:hypothetical protein BC938DRAFT_474486 [Jimgerdemannia flammicorona]|uniref:Uncharacterized protein n=1 Tax=Jimgerdemannia flammicorona TaxID=994334 RepID=A0A433QSI0_9FUNG|nr:hypothetical protein BC938DRAFT_474486 [Jimgerdemannia flammicorona]